MDAPCQFTARFSIKRFSLKKQSTWKSSSSPTNLSFLLPEPTRKSPMFSPLKSLTISFRTPSSSLLTSSVSRCSIAVALRSKYIFESNLSPTASGLDDDKSAVSLKDIKEKLDLDHRFSSPRMILTVSPSRKMPINGRDAAMRIRPKNSHALPALFHCGAKSSLY